VVLRNVKFYRKMWLKKDLLHDVFSVYMLDSCMNDDCLMSVFLPVYDNFKQYVFSLWCRMFVYLLHLSVFSLIYRSACFGE